MLTTKDKAKIISRIDSDMQDQSNIEWEDISSHIYAEAKGNKRGWTGIAEKDPMVIEEFYPVAMRFNKQ